MPICSLSLLASAGGLILREDVLRKRSIPRKRVWWRDAGVGGKTGNLKGQATADPAATPWRSYTLLVVDKSPCGSGRDTGEK